MEKLTRSQASIIFKARTRMLEVKNNFRNMFNNNTCRLCGAENETQAHILQECPQIHKDTTTKVTREDLFNNNINNLKETAHKIRTIIKTLLTDTSNRTS